ncbi:MAG: ABC transporter ATP-binding protein [Verrucomicrobiales bacterium]|nr:ABC transporter ATP-binding protein [Verrucomicrobiales bacterium]
MKTQDSETKAPAPSIPGAPTGESGAQDAKSMVPLVLELLRPYRVGLAIVFAAMMVETAMSLAAPWPLKVVLDNAVGGHKLPEWLAWLTDFSLGRTPLGLAAFAALATLLIAAVGAIASYVDNYYTESVGQWVANDLRLRVYHHLHRLSLSYFDTHQSGALISTITDDVQTIQNFASSSTLGILTDLLTIIGMLGLMFWLDWDFALIAVGVTPFLLLFVARFKKSVKKATHEVRKRESDLVSVVQQGLESVRSVKAFGRQDLEETRLADASRATVDAALKARRIKSLLSPVVSLVVAACTAIVLWRGAHLILTKAMTIGALTVFLAYLNKFFKPVQDLAKMTNTIAQAAVGLDRIRTILDTDTVMTQRPDARPVESLKGEVTFDKVEFSYDPESPVLRGVSFTVKPGQRIGICGPTGGGKSTVISLIPRFYDPSAGRVLIDGVDLRDYQLDGLRSHIAFVLQDTVLFRGTIRENIAYGRPDATPAEIEEAARLANAEEFIHKMPHGFDTMVGERGLTLSGGQRQRIGIARALVRNSPLLLLDEPTAALDTESEQLVMDALERLMKGRTVITIAHRLSTIRDADAIIVLKGGVVAEKGTHEELVKLGQVYAELYRIQAGGGNAPAPAQTH